MTNFILELESRNGSNFVSIKGYENKFGEVSNQVIQIGVDRSKRMAKDLQTLKDFSFVDSNGNLKPEFSKFDIELLSTAKAKLIESLEKRLLSEEEKEKLRAVNDATINRSDAQNDAYVYIANGLRYNFETEKLYVSGYATFKEVLVNGEYPTVNSRPLTLAKNAITKSADLLDSKFRSPQFSNITEIKVNGKLMKISEIK